MNASVDMDGHWMRSQTAPTGTNRRWQAAAAAGWLWNPGIPPPRNGNNFNGKAWNRPSMPDRRTAGTPAAAYPDNTDMGRRFQLEPPAEHATGPFIIPGVSRIISPVIPG